MPRKSGTSGSVGDVGKGPDHRHLAGVLPNGTAGSGRGPLEKDLLAGTSPAAYRYRVRFDRPHAVQRRPGSVCRVRQWSLPRKVCTVEMTTDPSPTAEATRLTEPARTSPTANSPGTEVSNAPCVITKPLSSS